MDQFNNQPREGGNALPFTAGEWAKGRDTVRVAVTEYKGKPLLDLRAWYETPQGELKPSPKGITLTLDAMPKLAHALNTAIDFAKSNGLLEGGAQ